jgi:hypothetical protein
VRDQDKRGEHKKVCYCNFVGVGIKDFVENVGMVLQKRGYCGWITTFKYGSWKENKETQEDEVSSEKHNSDTMLSELTP